MAWCERERVGHVFGLAGNTAPHHLRKHKTVASEAVLLCRNANHRAPLDAR